MSQFFPIFVWFYLQKSDRFYVLTNVTLLKSVQIFLFFLRFQIKQITFEQLKQYSLIDTKPQPTLTCLKAHWVKVSKERVS